MSVKVSDVGVVTTYFSLVGKVAVFQFEKICFAFVWDGNVQSCQRNSQVVIGQSVYGPETVLIGRVRRRVPRGC